MYCLADEILFSILKVQIATFSCRKVNCEVKEIYEMEEGSCSYRVSSLEIDGKVEDLQTMRGLLL